MKDETKCYCGHTTYCDCGPETIEDGTKLQEERSYSEEDMKDAYCNGALGLEYKKSFNESFNKWFEQFKNK